jgi:7-cyano-7-deazaguanine synthase
MRNRAAVVLLSGGLDSAVVGTIAKCERYELYCLTVDYGQRHAKELEAAARVAESLRAKEHKVIKLPLEAVARSALTHDDIEVPKDRTDDEIATGIPDTYVPARNAILLSLALAYAETVEADAIFIGAHAVDYSGYPDCRPEFIEAFQAVAKVATKRAVEGRPPKIFAPLLQWDKVRIIETGYDLRAPIKHSWSCYEDGDVQCGRCDACRIRRRSFEASGRTDPVPYAEDGARPAKKSAKKPMAKAAKAKPKKATKKRR